MDGYSALVSSIWLTICMLGSDAAPQDDYREINPDLLRNATVGPCQDDNWAYSNITGSCYMFKPTMEDVNFVDAIDSCKNFPGVSGPEKKLLYIEDEAEQLFLDKELLRFNYEPHWIAARWNPSANIYEWNHDQSEVTFTRWDVGEPSGGECVYIHRPDGLLEEWKWKTAACTATYAVYCKQIATRCPAMPTAEFIQPSFPKPNIEQTIQFSCMPGYQMPDYVARYTKWHADTAANLTNATEPAIKYNPTLTLHCNYSGQWEGNFDQAVAPCEPLSCEAVPTVKYAKANDTVTRIYPTWTEFYCDHGYYYKDINSRLKIGWCGSDVRWHDVPRQCDPVPCEPFERPGNATGYNEHLTFFGDVIAYKCHSGYMFPDGAVWKFVACRQNYVHELVGRWNETSFPACEILQCPAPPTGEHVIQTGNGTDHHTKINYTCVEGYEFPDSSTSVLLECSDDAIWKPSLPNAAEKPVPLPVTGKRYQPPTVDAPGASSIGSTSMVICIIMLIIIVLLDITTISRDIKLLKYNLKHFKRRITGRKQHTN